MLINSERLSELFDLYYNDIYRLCLGILQNNQNAEDIAQETFQFLVEKSDSLTDINLKAWLYNVATIKIKKFLKEEKSTEKHLEIIKNHLLETRGIDGTNEFEIQFEAEEISSELIDERKDIILSSLSDEEKSLYNDVFINKKKYKEISAESGVNPKTLSVRAYRLKAKIMAMIKNSADFSVFLLIF